MFTLILSICISSNGIATCEKQELYKALTKEQCLVKMENVLRDIHSSPFYGFEWEVSCEVDKTIKQENPVALFESETAWREHRQPMSFNVYFEQW